MPRGDGTGPTGSGAMTGRRMGSCSSPGTGGSFLRRGGSLGLLGLGMWLVRLWSAARRPDDAPPLVNNREAEDLRKRIAEMEETISGLKQRLSAAQGNEKQPGD
jgi:hypothetical protein